MRPGFPTTPGAFQPKALHQCGFAGKLKPDASGWVWASYVGTGYAVRDMTTDDKGDLYCILDYFAARRIPYPIDGNPRHHPDHPGIKSWLSEARKKINGRGGLHDPESGLFVRRVTGNPSKIKVYRRSLK